jgi:UDP:flavonoid glycosyltransferase YjiC (YdhE family)
VSRAGRYLILSWDGGGNTPAAINLGQRLVDRGHRVRLLGWESMATRARTAEVELRTYGSVPYWPSTKSQDDNWPELTRLLHGAATRDDILSEAEAFDPDVLVIDAMLGAGFDAAAQIGCPSAALVHVLHSSFVHEWGDGVMQRSVRGLLAGVDRVLALTPPGFDVDHDVGANTAFVGPIQPLGASSARPMEPVPDGLSEPGDPWVLLSLSTTQQAQLRALPALLAALESLPVRAMLTLGPAVPRDSVRPPDNVTVRSTSPTRTSCHTWRPS